MPSRPNREGSWEDSAALARLAARRATPAQRLAWLEEMQRIAWESGATRRALEDRWQREKAMWESSSRGRDR